MGYCNFYLVILFYIYNKIFCFFTIIKSKSRALLNSNELLYDELNLLAFAESDSDFEVDGAEMKKPLEDSKEIDRQSAEQLAQHNAAGLF